MMGKTSTRNDTQTELLTQLDELIKRGRHLTGLNPQSISNADKRNLHIDSRKFVIDSRANIKRIAGNDSEYYRSVITDGVEYPKRVSIPFLLDLISSLKSLRDAVDQGLLTSIESGLRANIHDDFMEQACQLIKSRYHIAAMVLIGGVLENHLQKMSQKHELTWDGSGSISTYNDLLKDEEYDTSVWRRIQAIGDRRNKAAHGNGKDIKSDDVKEDHKYIQRFLADYPA